MSEPSPAPICSNSKWMRSMLGTASAYERGRLLIRIESDTHLLPNQLSYPFNSGLCEIFSSPQPIGPKFHLWHPWAGVLKVCVFYGNWLSSLVAVATKSFHKLTMGKIEKWQAIADIYTKLFSPTEPKALGELIV